MRESCVLRMEQPATRFTQTLPTGNGTMGASIYGHVSTEYVLLNHEDLWLPFFKPEKVPRMSRYLADYRRMLENGNCHEADSFWRQSLKAEGWPDFVSLNPAHPALDLLIRQENNYVFSNYQRLLDMTTGEVQVLWDEQKIHFCRRAFVSRADDVFVMELSASRPGSLQAAFSLKRHGFMPGSSFAGFTKEEDLPLGTTSCVENGRLRFVGVYPDTTGYCAQACLHTDGTVTQEKDALCVTGAQQILLLLKIEKTDRPVEFQHEFPSLSYR